MKRIISVFVIIVITAAMLSGCGILQKMGLQKDANEDELRPVSSIVLNEEDAGKLSDKTPIKLYFANEDNTKLKMEIRYIDSAEAQKSTSHLASLIINELIKGPSDESSFKRTIPAEAKLRTPVSISDKVATVDMSKEFKTKHPGGKNAEKMTIYSIVNSLTELEGIEKVKFTIAGKEQKEYMGNFKFDALFPRSTALISKDSVETSIGNTDDSVTVEDEVGDGSQQNGQDIPTESQNNEDITETSGENSDEELPLLE
jgi:germination protein M